MGQGDNPLDMSKWKSPLAESIFGTGPSRAANRKARKARRKANRVTLSDRLFGSRQYGVEVDYGLAVKREGGRFWFSGGTKDTKITAKPGEMPPLGESVIIQTAAVEYKGGRVINKPKAVLLGYATEDGQIHTTRGRWQELHGGIRVGVIWVAVIIGGLIWWSQNGGPMDASMIGVSAAAVFLAVFLLIRSFQIWRDRRRFRRHLRELSQARVIMPGKPI